VGRYPGFTLPGKELRESPEGLLAFLCTGLLSLSSTTTGSRTRRPTVTLPSTPHLHGTLVTKSRVLQQVHEYVIDIIIHPAQHFDAFRDGGSVLN
jgi:hypothetical protein